jgi:hypothetical protein
MYPGRAPYNPKELGIKGSSLVLEIQIKEILLSLIFR